MKLFDVEEAVRTEEHLAHAGERIERRVGGRRVFDRGLFGVKRADGFRLLGKMRKAAADFVFLRNAAEEDSPRQRQLRASVTRRFLAQAFRHCSRGAEDKGVIQEQERLWRDSRRVA